MLMFVRFQAVLLGLLMVSCSQAATSSTNFVVINCDNLGYGDTQPFGSELHRTPSLNQMAAEGRKFTHFYSSAGVCTPSRASLMTGCYSQRIGMHDNPRDGWVLRPVSRYGLNPDEMTIAEVLKQQDYATAIIGKWHLGDQPEFLPTRQGFDYFYGIPYSDDMTARTWKTDGSKWPPLPLMQNETVIEAPTDRTTLTERYTSAATKWITEHQDTPFFLYLPHAMPGSTAHPYVGTAFAGKSANGPWGDSIEELDWSVGQILDHLKELNLAEKTLVIWTSDNGAPSNKNNFQRGSNLPLHGRGYSTSEGAFRVPMIAWQPGRIPAGTECSELATMMDLLPTFAHLAGTSPDPKRPIDGLDISPLILAEEGATTPHEAFYYYSGAQLQAIRSGPWKLFLPIKPAGNHPHFSAAQPPAPLLFNVVEDVRCEQNVALQNPDVVFQLWALAEQARDDLGDQNRQGNGQRVRGELPVDKQPVAQAL